MTRTIKNLPRSAEKRFSNLCSDAGVTVNKSDEDDTGWDFLLEFPQPKIENAPPDLQRIEVTARAQVKSRERGKLIAKLKLDNAQRFAATPEPCFIVLAAASDGGHPVRYFVRHFWRDEIARTLKRLRQADHKSKPIHKQSFVIRFGEVDEHTDDLVEWMRRTIADEGSEYAAQKRELNENLGYEDGRLIGTISFFQSDIEKFVDHAIGLDAEIELISARLVDQRFGIEAKTPVFDMKPHRVEIRSQPKPCVLEITDSKDRIHRFDGEMFTPGVPGLPVELVKARIVAGPLEALLGSGKPTLKYYFSPSDSHNLLHLAKCIALPVALDEGQAQVSVLVDGQRFDCGLVETTPNSDAALFRTAAKLIQALVTVAAKAENAEARLSLDDILENWDEVLEFRKYVEADTWDFSMGGDSGRLAQAKVERLIISPAILINDLRFTAVLAYPLKSEELIEGKRKVTFSKPALVRAIVDTHDKASHGKEVQNEIMRYAKRHGDGVITLIGNEEGEGYSAMAVNANPTK